MSYPLLACSFALGRGTHDLELESVRVQEADRVVVLAELREDLRRVQDFAFATAHPVMDCVHVRSSGNRERDVLQPGPVT